MPQCYLRFGTAKTVRFRWDWMRRTKGIRGRQGEAVRDAASRYSLLSPLQILQAFRLGDVAIPKRNRPIQVDSVRPPGSIGFVDLLGLECAQSPSEAHGWP